MFNRVEDLSQHSHTSVGIALAEFIAVLFLHLFALGGKKSLGTVWQHLMAAKTTVQYNYEDLDREEETNQHNIQRMRLTYGEDEEIVLKEETEMNT